MARARKQQLELETLLFSTPEQRVLRFLLSEPTTAFTPRVISSKLKGVRGLGGAEGISKTLATLEAVGLVDFVDNRRAVRLHEDCPCVQMLKTFGSVCDLQGLKRLLEPISTKGVLFGSRATGRARSDSDYNLLVITHEPEEVVRTASQHPLGKQIQLHAWTDSALEDARRRNPALAADVARGIVLWGSTW